MKSLVITDIVKDVWIVRNPRNQSQSIELKPFSVPLLDERRYMVEWMDEWR